jgi:hypothetical protein
LATNLTFLPSKAKTSRPSREAGEGLDGVGEDEAESGGGFGQESLTEWEWDAAELAVHGLDAGGQGAEVEGLAEGVVVRPLAVEEGVGDQLDEVGEREEILIGPSTVAVEELVEEVVRGAEVQEGENGIGQGQPPTHFPLKGFHGGPSSTRN